MEKAIWGMLGDAAAPRPASARIGNGARSEPLAVTQLILLYHLLDAAR